MAIQANEQFTLDTSQENGLMSFYRNLPEKPSSTIRLFDRTDYFTVYGEDAIFTAKELFKTQDLVKYSGNGSNRVEYVVLNKTHFEKWIRELLIVRQYRVEIYKNTGTYKQHDWTLARKASPGNLTEFEELLFTSGDSCNRVGVMAIKLGNDKGQKVIGVGFVDRSARKFLVCEIVDNDHFSNLEALLVQMGPTECVVPDGGNSADCTNIKKVMERCSVLYTERKRNEFSNKDIIQDLDRLLKFDKGVESALHLQEVNRTLAMDSLSALIKFLELLSEEYNLGHYKLSTFDPSQYVRLDAAGIQALNLMPTPVDRNKFQSLFGVLNRCGTMQGQRLLAQWIKQPLVDLNKICERQNLVGSFFEDVSLRQQLHEDYLKKFPDFQKYGGRFSSKRANLQDCYKVYQSLTKLPNLIQALEGHSGPYLTLIESYFTDMLKELKESFSNFLKLIESTMDFSLVDQNEYSIKAEFDDRLQELRQEMEEKKALMTASLKGVAKDLNLEVDKSVKLDFNAQTGYCFRITYKDEKVLRKKSHYRIMVANLSAGVRFEDEDLKVTNREYMALKAEYEEQQKAVVDEVIAIAAGYVDPLMQLGNLLAHLDVIVSLAVTAANAPGTYVKPKILPKESGIVKLTQSRHPCLELQDSLICIPNDANFDREKRFLIITGPNMGGKSTYLRTIGITVLMAQIGSFVPCESAEISIVDAILTRFGCQDSISLAVSSFMLEMIEMASILRVATSNSLILVDELGRGTSTYDGFGLAWAICEKIAADIKSYAVVATHFHRLTEMEESMPSVRNLHVTTLIGSDGPTFLYRIKPGVCDRSFGIHLAQLVNFPERALQYAKNKAEELEDFQSSTLQKHPELIGEDQAAVKKRQAVKREGEEIIADFLKKVKDCHLGSSNEQQFISELEKYKQEIANKNNAYVEDILNRPFDK